jgi:hypothetical protein
MGPTFGSLEGFGGTLMSLFKCEKLRRKTKEAKNEKLLEEKEYQMNL